MKNFKVMVEYDKEKNSVWISEDNSSGMKFQCGELSTVISIINGFSTYLAQLIYDEQWDKENDRWCEIDE